MDMAHLGDKFDSMVAVTEAAWAALHVGDVLVWDGWAAADIQLQAGCTFIVWMPEHPDQWL